MRFADPTVCPSCRGAIEAATRCPHCGLDLTTHEIQQAWQALVVADQWVEHARRKQGTGQPAQPPGTTAVVPQPAPAAPAQRRRSISAGSVLLGLGAVFILVAGSIFITVTWESLGVVGRALVLLAFTGLVGLLGWLITRRGLRASSEALWTVFLGLLTLDWFAARHEELAGLHTWPFGAAAAAWAVLVMAASWVVIRAGRQRLSVELLAPSIIAGSAACFGSVSVAAELEAAQTAFWPALLATAAVTAAGLALFVATVRIGAWICAVGAGLSGLVAIGAAVVEAVEDPSLSDLIRDRHGLPLVIVVALAVLAGAWVARVRWAASLVAAAGSATLVALPIEDAWDGRGGYLVVAGILLVAAWLFAAGGDWFRGVRLGVAFGWVGLALAASTWLARLLEIAVAGASSSRTDDIGSRLRPEEMLDTGPWWVAAVVAVALAATVVAARRWPEARAVREHLWPVASCVVALGSLAVVATFDPPAVGIGGAIVIAGTGLTFLVRAKGWRWVGPATAAAAPLVTLSSWPAAVVVWPVAGLVLGVVAIRDKDVWLRCASAVVAAGWGLGTTLPALELLTDDDRWTGLGLVVAALVGLAGSLFTIRDEPAHRAVEAVSAGLGALGLAIGSDSTLGFASFLWMVGGAGVVVLGLVSTRRRWYRWVGSGLLGTAYVLRLAASDVDVVEAYTLPFAVFLLAVGLWVMRDPQGPGSVRALLPGVALALLPSLPQALDEPAALRALLLGAASAAALAVGTWRRWKVPFIGGAVVLVLLVLANVGPIAFDLPRWVLIASVGAVLLAAGITWEDRVRDGRAVIRYVGSMR